jgi:hypothetical protein
MLNNNWLENISYMEHKNNLKYLQNSEMQYKIISNYLYHRTHPSTAYFVNYHWRKQQSCNFEMKITIRAIVWLVIQVEMCRTHPEFFLLLNLSKQKILFWKFHFSDNWHTDCVSFLTDVSSKILKLDKKKFWNFTKFSSPQGTKTSANIFEVGRWISFNSFLSMQFLIKSNEHEYAWSFYYQIGP